MKKLLLFPLFLLIFLTVEGQISATQSEINEQIWKPFIKTYNAFDTKGFMDLHTKDLMRVPIDSDNMSTFEEYKSNNEKDGAFSKKNNMSRTIEFRFKNRIYQENRAFEVGYYKLITQRPGKTNTFYGKFTVVLRKEEGRWKIALDSDTSEGITEEVFQSGKKLDEK